MVYGMISPVEAARRGLEATTLAVRPDGLVTHFAEPVGLCWPDTLPASVPAPLWWFGEPVPIRW